MAILTPDEPQRDTDRRAATKSITWAGASTTSPAIDVGLFGLGAFYLPADFNGDAISFEASNASDGTFAALHDNGATAVALTAAAGPRWYEMPPEVMTCRFFKFVSDNAPTADRTIELSLKT